MSQIELIMSAALGFAFAALIALLVGRLVWSYSARRGRRRTERSGPSAMAELMADRDRLKVEHAVLTRRFEMRVEELKTRIAEQTAELSRQRNQLDQFVGELGSKTELLRRREIELSQFREQVAPLESELATRTEALQQLKARIDGHEQAPEPEFVHAVGHAPALPMPDAGGFADLSPEAAQADPALQDRVTSRIAELSSLARQIEAQRQELLREQAELMALKDGMGRSQKRRRRKDDGSPPARKAPVVRKSRTRGPETVVEATGGPVPATEEAADPAANGMPPAEPRVADLKEADAVATRTETGENGTESADLNGSTADKAGEVGSPVPTDIAGEEGATVITLASRIRALQRGAQG